MNKISKGEQKVIDILTYNRIAFQREVSFYDLKGRKNSLLRFDFAILNSQNQIIALIEVDGIQHYKYTSYFHKSISDFKKQQEWDRRKNKYCLLHNIPLIRIPYWDIENLTLNQIFNEQSYRVRDKYHNDYIIRKGVKK